MPGKKLTARKRAELKQKKRKQQQKSNFPVFIIFFVIIIGGIAGAYYVITNMGSEEDDQNTNGQTTNIAPVANEDYFIVNKNSYIFRIEALNNDYDSNDDDLNITSITTPQHGEAEIMEGGTISYIPTVNFSGEDSFDYTISDGDKEATATINILIPDTINPVALFQTSKGAFAVELYYDKMPITCDNLINLAMSEFYDGMIFHRISDDFMIQAGNTYPDGTTKTSPFGNIEFEVSDVTHEDGTISMASSGAGVGGSSQFFICDGDQDFLNGNYAAFGKTIYGMDVVRDIADDPHDDSSSAGGGRPLDDIIINSISIHNLF
ncbi:MAG: peptidylprolyl isomerase [Thermoplasmatales archaeon]|nr:MAG: peptidylprolyl isomerase [Thermoplasmatales archaeon]